MYKTVFTKVHSQFVQECVCVRVLGFVCAGCVYELVRASVCMLSNGHLCM